MPNDIVAMGQEIASLDVQNPTDALENAKLNIVRYLHYHEAIWFSIAEQLYFIERNKLYKHAGYKTMGDYIPVLLEELNAHRSKRHMQEYLALYKIFVLHMGLTPSEIMELGPSHFTAIREAVDYDRATGEVKSDAEAREGKVGAETALAIIEELRNSGGEIRTADIRHELDAVRGVDRKNIHVFFRKVAGYYEVDQIGVYVNGIDYALDYDKAQWLVERMGATSNLDRLD